MVSILDDPCVDDIFNDFMNSQSLSGIFNDNVEKEIFSRENEILIPIFYRNEKHTVTSGLQNIRTVYGHEHQTTTCLENFWTENQISTPNPTYSGNENQSTPSSLENFQTENKISISTFQMTISENEISVPTFYDNEFQSELYSLDECFNKIPFSTLYGNENQMTISGEEEQLFKSIQSGDQMVNVPKSNPKENTAVNLLQNEDCDNFTSKELSSNNLLLEHPDFSSNSMVNPSQIMNELQTSPNSNHEYSPTDNVKAFDIDVEDYLLNEDDDFFSFMVDPMDEYSYPFPCSNNSRNLKKERNADAYQKRYDPFNWRKYGQKQVKGCENRRSYYRCANPKCTAKKQVRKDSDGDIEQIVYQIRHNHPKPGSDHLSKGYDGGSDETCPKKRRIEEEGIEMIEAIRTFREPNIILEVLSDTEILHDGFRWRKYGQKVVKGNPNPRSYYKCTSPGCSVRKHVERSPTDSKAVLVSYQGRHNHEKPPARNSGHDVNAGSSQSHVQKQVQTPLVQNDMARFGLNCLAPPPLGLGPPPPPPSNNFFPYGMNEHGLPNFSLPPFALPVPIPYLSHLPLGNDMGDNGLLMPKFGWNTKPMFANNNIDGNCNGNGMMLMPKIGRI